MKNMRMRIIPYPLLYYYIFGKFARFFGNINLFSLKLVDLTKNL